MSRTMVVLGACAAIVACGGDHPRNWGRADTAAAISDLEGTTRDTAAIDDSAPGAGPGAVAIVLAADSAAGDAVFHRRGQCFTCHGAAAVGIARLGPSLRDGVWLHSDGSLDGIAGTIAGGVAAPREAPIVMPGFARQLSESELRAVAAYVYAISHPDRVVNALPEVHVPQPGPLP